MNIKKQTFDIGGMSCSACSARVEKAVNALAGVQKNQVNLLTNSMVTEYDGDVLNETAIIEAVTAAGYTAAVKSPSKSQKTNPRKDQPDIASQQISEMKKRIIGSFCCLIPLIYIAMAGHMGLPLPAFFKGIENALPYTLTQFLLCLPVVILNRKYYINGLKHLFKGNPNMDSLIAVGSGSALIYGVIALYRMSWAMGAGNADIVAHYHGQLYFESAAMILTLITLGKFLEARAKGKTGEAITKLIDLSPKTALVRRDGVETEIPADQILPGEIFIVKPGAAIPADGVILIGTTAVDEAAITGESIPVEKNAGDQVIAATINTAGYIECRAEKVGEDTTFAEIIRLVQEASASKAPIARMADKVAGIFVPVVMGIAVLSFIVWMIAKGDFEFALSIGIAVLVISCPCALGLATPVAIMVGTGKGAENGILIKSGEALETASRIDTVVLDKTGTITEGKPKVTDVILLDKSMTEEEFIGIAVALESASEHPLAKAVQKYGENRQIIKPTVTNFEALSGLGIKGLINNQLYAAGNLRFILDTFVIDKTAFANLQKIIESLADEGKTPLIFADAVHILGIIAVADTVKSDSAQAIADLQKLGINCIMLTGDNIKTAEAIRKQINIDQVIADVLPGDKEKVITELQNKGHQVAMVGDGINDAPALTRSDVGMAIGAGTDVAIESADVVLMHSSLQDAVSAIRLSKAVIRNIRQNLFWAFFYNIVGIPIAAGVLYPFFGITLSPMIGSVAMSCSSVCVVTNALRLKGLKLRSKLPEPIQAENINQKENKMVRLKIEGMMCMHCVAHVEKALTALGAKVEVSLEKGTAVVTEIPDGVSKEQLAQAVVDAGYQVVEMIEE